MKLSRFNIWVEDYPKKGENLLFNSRTQALIKIDNPFKEALLELSPKIQESLPALKNNGIIVEDAKEEELKLKDFFRQLKYENNNLAFEATILTTYSCNFKCVYCFEESVKENTSLDEKTSELIVNWLIKTIEKRGLERIFLVFYGGEPLLNTRPIYNISDKIKKYAEKEGIDFGFGIITNGSLIKRDLVGRLLSIGLKEIRVTIDGDREAHNQKRPFLDGSGTFDLIIDNIKDVIDRLNLSIAGNFDRQSFPGILRLIDYLEKEGLLNRLDRIGFAPIVPRLGPKSNPAAIELAECGSFISENGLFKEMILAQRELLQRGVKIITGLAINACPLVMQDAGVTIDPKGLIYKCNSLLGYPEFSVGDVRQEGFNSNLERFFNIDAWNKCQPDCPYIPMCQGGCRFFSFIENNNFTDLSCKRKYMDLIIGDLIKLEYDSLRAQSR